MSWSTSTGTSGWPSQIGAGDWSSVELAAIAASITLTPPNYGTHYEVELSCRSTTTGAAVGTGKVQVNGDTTATNYHTQFSSTTNGSANVVEANSQAVFQHPTADCVSGYFGVVTLKFYNFRRTDRQKTWIAEWAHETAALNQSYGGSSSKRQGASVTGTLLDAITSIVILPAADNWAIGTVVRWRVIA